MKQKMKRILITTSILIVIGATATWFIGDYFVTYALVPNQGAENRDVEEPVTLADSSIEEKIEQERELAEERKSEWLQRVSPLTNHVTIQSDEGLTLSGHTYLQAQPTEDWMIILHGYQVDESEAQRTAPEIYDAGFNILTIDLRAHGNSEGDYIGMGYLDRYDLVNWIERLVEKHPDSRIVLHGSSMGGATVLMASALDLPLNVKAIIADASYSSIREIFASELKKRFNLPAFPVIDMGGVVSRIKAGYHLNEGDVVKYVKESELPIFFIHGDADDFVPFEMGQDLYQAKEKGPKEKSVYPGAGHIESKFSEPERYFDEVINFARKHVNE